MPGSIYSQAGDKLAKLAFKVSGTADVDFTPVLEAVAAFTTPINAIGETTSGLDANFTEFITALSGG